MREMTCALVFALLQFSAAVYASTGASQIDDTTAMIQSKSALWMSEDEPMLLMKSSGVGQLLQVHGSERLEASQKMEKSMELAVTKTIANMKSGNYVAPPPEFFEPIETQIELMRQVLLGERNGFQQQMNIANANVEKCNTNMQTTSNGSVATAKANVDYLKGTHHTCRGLEKVAYDAKTSSCDALVAETLDTANAAPSCNCGLSTTDTSAVLTCLESNNNWVEAYETVLTTKKSDCDNKTDAWSSKADACDTDQLSYEVAVCSYAEKLENMRSTLDSCYNDAIAARTSTVEMVKVEVEHLKAILASAKKIMCFVGVLKRAGTENVTMSDFETCKEMDVYTDITHLNNSVPDMNVTFLPAVAKDIDRFEWDLTIMPGDVQWAAQEYANYTTSWLRHTSVCSHKAFSYRLEDGRYCGESRAEPYQTDITPENCKTQCDRNSSCLSYEIISEVGIANGFSNWCVIRTTDDCGISTKSGKNWARYAKLWSTDAPSDDWVLVFRQSWPQTFSAGEWSKNPSDPSNANYAILDTLEQFRHDGAFTFKFRWPASGLYDQTWKQTSNPVTKTEGGVDGYEPVDVHYTGAGWGGLEHNTRPASLLDGSPGKFWWYAVGSTEEYAGGIPGPMVVQVVELYVKQA